MAKNFDDILMSVGSYGRYQREIIAYILVPVSFFVAFMMCTLLFQVIVPDHWCHVPGRNNTSLSRQEWLNLTLPRSLESDKYSKCEMYEVVWTDTSFIVSNDTLACNSGWEHDDSQMSATLATSNSWLCDREQYSSHILSANMAGNAVGTFLLPLLADRYLGRRLVFFLSLVNHIVFTLAATYFTNYGVHLAIRFLRGLTFETDYLMPYVICLEFLSPAMRDLAVMLSFVSWTAGMCATSLVAWFVPHWQHLAYIACIPALLGFLLWRYLPESPRWLLSKGRVSECTDILLKIAKRNGTTDKISRTRLEGDLQQLRLEKDMETVSFSDVLKYPKLCLRAVLLITLSLTLFMVYGVILIGINVMASNYFLSHFILSLSELPSNVFGWAFAHYFGRRFMTFTSLIVTGIFCIAGPFCLHSEWLLLTVVSMIKLFDTQSIYTVFVLSAEIFPTPIRTTGTGLVVVFGMLAMVFSPYILNSGFGPTFQYWTMLALTVVSFLVMLPIPETVGLPLPQTFQQAEDLGQGRPLTTWIHNWNYKKFGPQKSTELNDHPQQLQELQEEQKKLTSNTQRGGD